jgi:hypothetical protein
MKQMNRRDALDEATFAAMETVISLMRAEDRQDSRHGPEGIEYMREALASARAAVVAAGYALTTATDAVRVTGREKTGQAG